jgi:HD-like signal output (HDOD) protein
MNKKQKNKAYRSKAIKENLKIAQCNQIFNALMRSWPVPKPTLNPTPKNHAAKILL